MKTYSHEKIKEFIDCGISEISLAESKTVFTEKRKNSIISYILKDKDDNTNTDTSKIKNKSNLTTKSITKL